jgi:dihydrofolate reductase
MVTAAGSKNVWIVGGGELAGQFYDYGLLDELFVQVGSVTLGAGKPLCRGHHQPAATSDLSESSRHWLRRVALQGPE